MATATKRPTKRLVQWFAAAVRRSTEAHVRCDCCGGDLPPRCLRLVLTH